MNLHAQLTEAANTIGSLLKTDIQGDVTSYRVYHKKLQVLIKGIESDFSEIPIKELKMSGEPTYIKQCMQIDDK